MPVVLPRVSFSVEQFVSFVQFFCNIIKEKCCPLNEGIIQQPSMSIHKVITTMTEFKATFVKITLFVLLL